MTREVRRKCVPLPLCRASKLGVEAPLRSSTRSPALALHRVRAALTIALPIGLCCSAPSHDNEPGMSAKRKPSAKAKKAAFLTSDEDLAPFGFQLWDIIRTPLGICGTVIGVKLVEASQPETARLWVAYDSGLEAPLEPQVSAGKLNELGYSRVSEADHVRRDMKSLQAAEAAWEVTKKEMTDEAAKKAAEAADPDKKGKDAKDKKKGK